MHSVKLPKEFYTGTDTVAIAKQLLGKLLVTNMQGNITSGIITETEAYCGTEDRGCHAYNGRRTNRTAIMYAAGGVSYVYLCYGIHCLFNVVTHQAGNPHAVLIRAVQPVDGIDIMLQRTGKLLYTPQLASGPGLVAKCLGIGLMHNGIDLTSEQIFVAETGSEPMEIIESARVGMHFDGIYKSIPWRFRIAGSAYTGKAK